MTTESDIELLCREAAENQFWSVCVNPFWVRTAARILQGRSRVCTVVGFPLGANVTETKVREVRNAITDGADEIDGVLNIGAIASEKYRLVEYEIAEVTRITREDAAKLKRKILVKAIVESYLFLHAADPQGREKLKRVCTILKDTPVDFVKTCTGFDTGYGKSVTTADDVAYIRSLVGPSMGIKAAGGINSLELVKQLIASGATRIGTSHAAKIMAELESKRIQ